MEPNGPPQANPSRRERLRRIIAAVLAALPAAGFALIGGIWLYAVLWDRYVERAPRNILSHAFYTLPEPSLILLGGLLCITCAFALARANAGGLVLRLVLGAIASAPAALTGAFAGYWIVEHLFFLPYRIDPEHMAVAVTGLAAGMLSTAAGIWLMLHRRQDRGHKAFF
jgi:hypothetical protein